MSTAACPVCTSPRTAVFLDRPRVPVHQNLLLPTREAARAIAHGHLLMCCCESCGFVFNGDFDESLLNYGDAYENTQTHSAAFEQYVDGLADSIITGGPRGSHIVEVGCGKGGFIRKLLEKDPAARGVGFDPTYIGPLEQLGGRLRFERRFYDEHAANVPADVVVCRHVIEHVPQPLVLLRSVRRAVGDSPSARIYFETPDVSWILRHGVVWDFFYEHCSLFTPASLSAAFEAAGFGVAAVRTVFGDQYQWLQASPSASVGARFSAGEVPQLAQQFGREANRRVDRWLERLHEWRRTGPLVLWGAGAKGVTLANLVDADARLIDAVVDVNAAKQGKFLAGTGHPIVSPADLARIRPRFALVLNPNYRLEIQREIDARGIDCRVIDLMQATD